MHWVSLWISCLRCTHFVCPNPKWTDLARCTYYGTFAESARKNVTECGPEAKGYRSFDTQREEKYQIKDS